MATVSVERLIGAPMDTVWDSWDDYANIDKFNPGIKNSYLLGDKQPTGLGALRQCDFSDGKTYVREKITGYEKHKSLTLDIYESNAPIKQATATLKFTSIHANQTRIVMTMNFTPKMGLFGKLLTPLMKGQFRKALGELLAGNATFVETQHRTPAAA